MSMAVDEPPLQQNGTPTSRSHADGNPTSTAKDAEHPRHEKSLVTHDSQTIEGKDDVDKFGLPVKKSRRQSASSEQDEATVRDRDANAFGQPSGETHAEEQLGMKASTHAAQSEVPETNGIPSQTPLYPRAPTVRLRALMKAILPSLLQPPRRRQTSMLRAMPW